MSGATPKSSGPIRLQAHYTSADKGLEELSRSLAKGSTVIQSPRPLPEGTEFVFEITSPELDTPLEIKGVVTAVVEPGQDTSGRPQYNINIDYVFDDEQHRRRIAAAVSHIMNRHQYDVGRSHPRVPTAYRVTEADDPLGAAYQVKNLSEGGMFLATDAPDLGGESILEHTPVTFQLTVAGTTHNWTGHVIRTDTGPEGVRAAEGFAVQFDALPEATRHVLLQLMQHQVDPDAWTLTFG